MKRKATILLPESGQVAVWPNICWKTGVRNKIRQGFAFTSILALLVCTAASCGPEKSAMRGPSCTFSDPEFVTSLCICNLVAEYYIAKHEWPVSQAQLEEGFEKELSEEKARRSLSNEEEKEQLLGKDEFFGRFTLLDLRKKGDNLVFHYRFKIDKQTVDQTVMMKPGATADEILQTATGRNE